MSEKNTAAPVAQNERVHDSDCARHNMPAYPNGPCDCSLSRTESEAFESYMRSRMFAYFDRNSDGTYKSAAIHHAWGVWKARAALAQEESA